MNDKDRTDNPIEPTPNPDPVPNKVTDIFEVNHSNPTDGSIKLTLKPQQDLSVGDEIELNARLTSPDGDMESIFYVKIIDPQIPKKNPTKKEPEKPELPKVIKITKKDNNTWQQDNGADWNEVIDWDENSIIHVITDEQKTVSAIAINMDSHSLKQYISKNKATTEKDIEYLSNQYVTKIYLHGLFLYAILDKLKSQENKQDKYASGNQSSDVLLSQIFKNYGDVLIHLDTNKEILGSIEDE